MAFNIKSNKLFKIMIGFSALCISSMAATFSVTGIATLFSGYFTTIAIMMTSLEFGKIVVASFLARYWEHLSKVLKTYFLLAVTTLILITSAGIFGYLSDAYQTTKGDYSIIEKQSNILLAKKNMFLERKERLLADRNMEFNYKNSNMTRMDSLTSRNQNSSRVRLDIKDTEVRISDLNSKLNVIEDSISYYDMQIVELESKNIKGELGPLKYIADAFNTDMDTVVKYFIFMLIFVFDPFAILLFVSLNLISKKELSDKRSTEQENKTPIVSDFKNTNYEDDISYNEDDTDNFATEEPYFENEIEQEVEQEVEQEEQKNGVVSDAVEEKPEVSEKDDSLTEKDVDEIIGNLDNDKKVDDSKHGSVQWKTSNYRG